MPPQAKLGGLAVATSVDLGFYPEADGFAFNNNWTLDQYEIDRIHDLFQESVTPVVAALAPILTPAAGVLDILGSFVGIPPGTLELVGLGLTITGKLNGLVDNLLPQGFGLCGGMAYAAADYFRWQLVPPRGFPGPETEKVHPDHTTPQGRVLRDYLWSRHLDSWTTGSAAIRTLEWMAILHLIPPELGGGADELGRRSRDEWHILKSHIDNGNPWPITLIGTTTDVSHQHQVMVYGYDQINAQEATISFYDSNHPAQARQRS